MVPHWLHVLSIVALLTGFACAAVIMIDLLRHPQHMGVMNLVWPILGLFLFGVAVWAYFRYGRLASRQAVATAQRAGEEPPNRTGTPYWMMVAKGAGHCGSGCTLGDIVAEWLAFAVPTIAVWLGWRTLFADKLFAVWILDFVLAFLFGIAFQYFTIAPMRGLGLRQGLWQALKADALSLTAWQVGMYGFMAVAHFALFGALLGVRLEVASVEFWFAMQIAMICGFLTSYPVNWWLLRSGLKEAM